MHNQFRIDLHVPTRTRSIVRYGAYGRVPKTHAASPRSCAPVMVLCIPLSFRNANTKYITYLLVHQHSIYINRKRMYGMKVKRKEREDDLIVRNMKILFHL